MIGINEVRDIICEGLAKYLISIDIIDNENVENIRNGKELPYLNECFVASKKFDVQIIFNEMYRKPVIFGNNENNGLNILFYDKGYFLKID